MFLGLSRHGGRGRRSPAASLFPVALTALALFAPIALLAQPTPAPPASLTAISPAPVTHLLIRAAPHLMGDNNGVHLWVRGDGSGATLRVRVLETGGAALTPETNALYPAWISEPIALTFTGWKAIVLPRDEFTLRAPIAQATVDPALPADAQTPASAAASAPEWASADSIGLETNTARRADVIVDDISWAKLDAQGNVISQTPVDDFETGDTAAWQRVSRPDLDPYLVVGLATQAGDVHGGRTALKLDILSPAARRETLLPALKRALAITGKPYLVFTPATLFEPILPTSLPDPGGTSAMISMQACPDQTQAASFCLYTQQPLTGVTVLLRDGLQGIGHVISKDNVDIHVVKVWNQDGDGPLRDSDAAALVPELLVKDDRAPLSGVAPDVRLTGIPVCDIPADSTKQFWITVTVPLGTAPGSYTGKLVVSGQGLKTFPVLMDLTVLPLRLLSPAKQYGIDLRARLDPAPTVLPSPDGQSLVTDYVSKEMLDSELADIVAHGFHIATIYDSPSTLWDAVAEYKAAGVLGPYIYKGDGDPRTIEAERQAHNAADFYYYTCPDPLGAADARMAVLSKKRIPSTTYITQQADFDALQANLDVPVYNRDSAYTQKLIQTKGRRLSDKRDWWYWNATDENPEANRLACGYLLWRADLYGAFIPDYQTPFGADPYDETSAGAAPSKAAYRPLMLTYPAKDGVMDTLQWEAAREGVADVRYLTTLYAALRECKDAHIAKPLTAAAEAYVKALMDRPFALMSDADFDKARAQTAQYAIKLRAAVEFYNKKNGIR